jgi:hypothetical protein
MQGTGQNLALHLAFHRVAVARRNPIARAFHGSFLAYDGCFLHYMGSEPVQAIVTNTYFARSAVKTCCRADAKGSFLPE